MPLTLPLAKAAKARRNPLADVPIKTVIAQAKEFADKNKIKSWNLIVRAALLVKDENLLPAFDTIDSLTDTQREQWDEVLDEIGGGARTREKDWILTSVEKVALADEKSENLMTLLRSLPPKLYAAVTVVALAATVQGWDQVSISAANLKFPKDLGIDGNDLIVGLVNASPFLAVTAISSWLADPLNYVFGRRGTIFVGAVLSFFAPLISVAWKKWQWLVAWRFMLGVGMGLKEVTVPIYAAEISPTSIRGSLVMSWQIFTALGIFLGSCSNRAFLSLSYSWRMQLGSACLPALFLLALVHFCPESPRYAIKKQRFNEAFESLQKLRKTPLQAARDLYEIHEYLKEYDESIYSSGDTTFNGAMRNVVVRFTHLFNPEEKREFWANWAATVVMTAQQFCGINAVINYAPFIFDNTGQDPTKSIWLSLGFGAINFVFAWPAFIFIDKIGRRGLLLLTFPVMFLCLLAVCLLYQADPVRQSSGSGSYDNHLSDAAAAFIIFFVLVYSPGAGPVPFTYSAEVFQLSHREVGMGWAVAVNNGFGALLLWTFLPMQRHWGAGGAFGFYAVLNALIYPFIWFFVRETKQKSLEGLNNIMTLTLTRFAHNTLEENQKTLSRYYHKLFGGSNNAQEDLEGSSEDGVPLHDVAGKTSLVQQGAEFLEHSGPHSID